MADKQTFAGATLAICATPQPNVLNQAAFAALTYVSIGSIGSVGEWSTSPNILNYNTLNEDVIQKQKGVDNGGDPEVEVAYDAADAGQDALRAAAETKASYAFKLTLVGGEVWYNRGVVGGPRRPGGRNEDFLLQVFNLGFNQKTIVV